VTRKRWQITHSDLCSKGGRSDSFHFENNALVTAGLARSAGMTNGNEERSRRVGWAHGALPIRISNSTRVVVARSLVTKLRSNFALKRRPAYARCASSAGQESAGAPLARRRKQSRVAAATLDCFACDRNDGHIHLRILAAGFARGLPNSCPSEIGGRRECRVFCAPAASCAVRKAHELETTGTPNSPAFPARWLYGL
jgi:hypothetical protein